MNKRAHLIVSLYLSLATCFIWIAVLYATANEYRVESEQALQMIVRTSVDLEKTKWLARDQELAVAQCYRNKPPAWKESIAHLQPDGGN